MLCARGVCAHRCTSATSASNQLERTSAVQTPTFLPRCLLADKFVGFKRRGCQKASQEKREICKSSQDDDKVFVEQAKEAPVWHGYHFVSGRSRSREVQPACCLHNKAQGAWVSPAAWRAASAGMLSSPLLWGAGRLHCRQHCWDVFVLLSTPLRDLLPQPYVILQEVEKQAAAVKAGRDGFCLGDDQALICCSSLPDLCKAISVFLKLSNFWPCSIPTRTDLRHP